MSEETTRQMLERAGVHPSKKMGQSFLTDPGPLGRIAHLVGEASGETILEVGAGTGNLTGHLADLGTQVVALERDRRLVDVLARRFESVDAVTVVAGDALHLPLKRRLAPGRVTVAGNIPYSITGEIIRHLGDDQPAVGRAVLTVQKEVADRLAAEPGQSEYGAFTILTLARFDVRRCFDIAASCFVPRPEVDSTVLELRRPDQPRVKHALYHLVRRLVHEAFQRRRKTLHNSLGPFFSQLGVRDDTIDAVFLAAGLDPGQRPQTVPIERWAKMAQALRGVIR